MARRHRRAVLVQFDGHEADTWIEPTEDPGRTNSTPCADLGEGAAPVLRRDGSKKASGFWAAGATEAQPFRLAVGEPSKGWHVRLLARISIHYR
jgi:hypothetical protein